MGRTRVSLIFVLLACGACTGGWFDGGVGRVGADDPPQVIYLTSGPPEALPPEEAAAWAWLQGNEAFASRQVQMIDLPNMELPPEAVIWWHYAAEEALPSISVHPQVLQRVSDHLRSGGTALLTLLAASYVVPLRIEPIPPDTVSTRARFVGDGAEIGGLQSRRGHPLLDRFWGGVFSAGDIDYDAHPAVAYSGDRWPAAGRVWAVHQSERGVDADRKIGVEYENVFSGGGRVLTLGAHCYFDDVNGNRAQLEQMVADALSYLSRGTAAPTGTVVAVADETPPAAAADDETRYWEPTAGEFTAAEITASRLPPEPDAGTVLNRVRGSLSGIAIKRYDDASPFTLAVPRAVLRGSQRGFIEEFRVHPVSLLKELRIGIVRPDRGVTWLDEGTGSREFTARPEGDELYYNDGEMEISLYLTVDRRFPALVGLLTVRSPAAVELIATWRADPGAPTVGASHDSTPLIGWDEGAQAVVWTTASGAVAKAGFGRETAHHIIGFDPAVHLDEGGLRAAAEQPDEEAALSVASAGTRSDAAPDVAPGSDPTTDRGRAPGADPTAEGSSLAAPDDANPPDVAPAEPDLGRVALQVSIRRGSPAVLPFVVVGDAEDNVDIDGAFAELIAAPGRAWVDNAAHYRAFLGGGSMGLLAPDTTFENVFKWAKTGIEALRLTQPGVGTALAAGYGATEPPAEWSAAANALGGSGALWASMTADAYGDRGLAASTLQLMGAYQGIDGRIPDAIGPGGRVVERGVEATALYLIALDNHVRTWGDLELLSTLWPTVERALEFLLAADVDADGLLDGRSRLDRFSDDKAVRTTIHLAALWGSALESGVRLFAAHGNEGSLPPTTEILTPLRATLNDAFWNANERRFNFAKRVDGSFVATSTVLPAVPMIFDLLDAGIANAALDALSSAELSHDWGVALVGTPIAPTDVAGEVPGASPPPAAPMPSVGLPSPAAAMVSPIFTGWAALAEYKGQRPVAGFAHLATNLLLLEHGNVGYAVDGFDAESFELRGDMPHLAASQAMTLLPAIWGMLGIRPDAVNRRVHITPQLPAGWSRVNVDRIRVGDAEFDLVVRRGAGETLFEIKGWSGSRDLELHLSAYTPAEVDISVDPEVVGLELVDSVTLENGANRVATAVVRPADGSGVGVVTFHHEPFPRLVSPAIALRPGGASSNVRVVRTSYLGGVMRIEIEGLPGRDYTLTLATPWNISQVTGVPDPVVTQPEGGIATLRATIPGSGPRYRRINLEVSFEQ